MVRGGLILGGLGHPALVSANGRLVESAVKPSRRITKARRRLSGAASPGSAAARETCPDSSILDSPFEELRLSCPVESVVKPATQERFGLKKRT